LPSRKALAVGTDFGHLGLEARWKKKKKKETMPIRNGSQTIMATLIGPMPSTHLASLVDKTAKQAKAR